MASASHTHMYDIYIFILHISKITWKLHTNINTSQFQHNSRPQQFSNGFFSGFAAVHLNCLESKFSQPDCFWKRWFDKKLPADYGRSHVHGDKMCLFVYKYSTQLGNMYTKNTGDPVTHLDPSWVHFLVLEKSSWASFLCENLGFRDGQSKLAGSNEKSRESWLFWFIYITLGPQNHEKWRFYSPHIWVATPKNEGCGFPWYWSQEEMIEQKAAMMWLQTWWSNRRKCPFSGPRLFMGNHQDVREIAAFSLLTSVCSRKFLWLYDLWKSMATSPPPPPRMSLPQKKYGVFKDHSGSESLRPIFEIVPS